MRKTALTLTLFALGAPLAAQGNEVLRNNEPYLVQTVATHPTTGVNFNWPPVNPAEYAYTTTSTVPANTRSWRIFPKETNWRFNRRLVDGYTFLVKLSAASAGSSTNAYEPECALHATKARVPGPGLDPNWAKQLNVLAQMPGIATGQIYTITRSFSPVSIPTNPSLANGSDNLTVSFKWAGGENDNLPDQQGFVGSWMDGVTPWQTNGFYYPGTMTTVYSTATTATQDFFLWGSYTEAEGTLEIYSGWGKRRIAPLTPPLLGHSLASFYGDAASKFGSFGLSVRSAGHPNGVAAPLFNFGPYLPVGFPFLGQTLDLNIADPNIGLLLNAGYVLLLDGAGLADGPAIPMPRNPALLGLSFGFECYLLSASFAISGSTQAGYIQITR